MELGTGSPDVALGRFFATTPMAGRVSKDVVERFDDMKTMTVVAGRVFETADAIVTALHTGSHSCRWHPPRRY